MRHVDATGFEIRVQEWDDLDGTHTTETVGYLVEVEDMVVNPFAASGANQVWPIRCRTPQASFPTARSRGINLSVCNGFC